MDITEIVVIMLLLGLILGLFIAYLQSKVSKDIWSDVKIVCAIAGGSFFLLFIYSGVFIWYYVAVAFFSIIMYGPHEGNKYSYNNLMRPRERFTPHRFRRPYSRDREERPQLEEWL